MAAAALAAPAVQQGVHEGVEAVKEFMEDPILNTCDLLVKVGAVFAISGAFLYAVAKATVRPEQQFLNDANDRLGLPPSTSPTPPKVPPTAAPPPYAVEFQAIINDLLGISQVSSADATNTLLDAQQHANNLFAILNGAVTTAQGPAGSPTTSYTLTPPPGVNNDLNYLIEILGNAANLMSGLTADGKSKNPAGVDWASTKTYVTSAANTMIALGNDLALPAPFVFASVDATTPPQSNNSFWGIFSGPGAAAFSSIQDAGAAALGAVENAVGTAFNDVSQFAGDVGQAVAFIGKAMMNFPFLFGDAIGYAVSWGVNTLATDLWPFLLGLGLLFMAAGLVGKFVYVKFWPRLERRIELNANARVARLWNRFDKWNGSRRKVQEVWTQKSTEGQIAAVNRNPVYVDPVIEAPEPAPALPPSNTPAENSHEKGGGKGPKPEKPIPGGATTAETEDLLGGHHAAEPTAEELRAQEAARKASMPPTPPPAPAEATPEPTGPTAPPQPVEVTVNVAAAPRRQKPHDRREPTAEQLMAMATRYG